MSEIEAWVVHAESTGKTPRSTDDPLFPWRWGEAIVVLPPDASPRERASALAAAAQMSHFLDDSRSDVPAFRHRDGHFYPLAAAGYFDAVHPYLSVSPACNVRYVDPQPGEVRGHVTFDKVPFRES